MLHCAISSEHCGTPLQALVRRLQAPVLGVRCSEAAGEIVAGGAAGVLAWASIYPIEVVKSRVQACDTASAWAVWRRLHASGWEGYVRGMPATLARAFVVNGAIFYGVGAARRLLGAPVESGGG